MRKRERESPCGVCGHYHKYEEGEVCGICGHRMPEPSSASDHPHISAFPSEILPQFLYLGSYDNASRSELLKAVGITHILNVKTVPSCQNLYRNSFTYHSLSDDPTLQFDDAIQFLEKCEQEKARVLVHCMLGKNRSPAIVIAYLMKSKGWKLGQGLQWVKERRPSVDISQAVYQQLQEYEKKIFGAMDNKISTFAPSFPPSEVPAFSFGFPKVNDPVPTPAFNSIGTTSIFARPLDVPPQEFQFGGHPSSSVEQTSPNGGDIAMDT